MAARTATVLFVLGLFVLIVALILNAAWMAVFSHPSGERIQSEIDQLHNSIQAYKEKYLVYPPCMGESDPDARKRQFMTHLQKVYPSSGYGVQVADFDNLNNYIRQNYKVEAGGSGGPIVALDLNSLDPAEALVFWLGGFPTPVATGTGGNGPIAPSRLFGFNKDWDSPIKRSLAQEATDPLATRTTARFDFRQERMVDNDEDGWWEYVPSPATTGAAVAPFVYFDSATYRRSSETPNLLGTVLYPKDPKLAALFGTAVPFAESYNPADAGSPKWSHPDSFQIICGGLDGNLSAPSTGPRVEIFPLAASHAGGLPPAGSDIELDDEERDNVTNLARGTLGDDESGGSGGLGPLLVYGYLGGVLVLAVLIRLGSYVFGESSRGTANPP
jgi:hypothetical protein